MMAFAGFARTRALRRIVAYFTPLQRCVEAISGGFQENRRL